MPITARASSAADQWGNIQRSIRRKALLGLAKGLVESGKLVKASADSMAPEHIKQGGKIRVSDVFTESGAVSAKSAVLMIRIGVSLKDAPDARAQELGSGLHATYGLQSKYVIKVKNAPALSFMWYKTTVGYPYLYPEKDPEKVNFLQVNHPGIRPKPYLRPALKENKELIKDILKNAVIAEVQNAK